LSAADNGRFLITLLFLSSTVDQLVEQRWLQARGAGDEGAAKYSAYLNSAFANELTQLAFLAPVFRRSSKRELKVIVDAVRRLIPAVTDDVLRYDPGAYAEFLRSAVARMGELTCWGANEAWESRSPARGLSDVFYRAFDAMDAVFGLNFARDLGMRNVAETKERLYEGAGLGVQTSYSTILTALYHLRLPQGAHVMDLGSGYGRLGLMTALWREDLLFTGYEFVAHRVEVAEAAARRAGLSERVRFVAQDLGDPAFEIPIADAYYMYDPFCAETYERVLRRIQQIGETRPLAIVTKGNAGPWFERLVVGRDWLAPERHDDGTLLIFRNHRL